MSVLNSTQQDLDPGVYFKQPLAEDLSIFTPSVSPDETNLSVLEIFGKHREMACLPVLENECPIGLINRNIFMSQMSRQYHREIYDKKSCIAFMDKDPLIVEANTRIEKLGELAVMYGDKALTDGFIIVREGKFTGLGSGVDLLKVIVDLQAEKNRQVTQSIEYASVIQRAMLSPCKDAMSATLPDACLVWEPRDIVGGDFYHFTQSDNGWFAAVVDCTGHGVPGAILTTIAASSLNQAIQISGTDDPARLLGDVNQGIKQSLGQYSQSDRLSESDEGMDAAFLAFNSTSRILTIASACMPLFILHPGEEKISIVNGERQGLGYVDTPPDATWKNKTITLSEGTVVLLATDGLADQIGGQKKIAFGKKRIKDVLLACRDRSMQELAETLMEMHQHYQGEQNRRDDLTLFGFRV